VESIERVLKLIPDLLAAGLLDVSGGNLALRVEEGVMITPTQAAEQLRWRLEPDDFILFPGGGEASMARAGRRPSRDNRVHRAVLAAQPDWDFSWHGHPWGLLSFCVAKQPLPVPHSHAELLRPARPHEIPLVPQIPVGTAELGEQVAEAMLATFKGCQRGAVLIGGHGPVVAGQGIEATLSLVQTLENLARAQTWRLRAAPPDDES